MYNVFNISSFLIGVSTAFFAACSLYILVLHRERVRLDNGGMGSVEY